MAKGDLIINDIDVFTYFGAYPVLGGLSGVLSWGAPKALVGTSWFEESGEDIDLEKIHLNATKFNVSLALNGKHGSVLYFYSFVGLKTKTTWKMPCIGVSMPLRVESLASVETVGDAYAASLSVVHDNIWDFDLIVDNQTVDWAYPSPFVPQSVKDNTYSLDGRPLTDYGVRVGMGSEVSLLRAGAAKKVLERDISTVDGIIGDFGRNNKFSSSDIVLKCVASGASAYDCLVYYYAMLYDLTSPDATKEVTRRCEKTLTVKHGTDTAVYYCFFKEQRVNNVTVLPGGGLWIEFTLTLGRVNGLITE